MNFAFSFSKNVPRMFMGLVDEWDVDWLWLFEEQHLDEGQGGLVQLLQLLLHVAHIELGDVQKGLLLVLAQEWGDARQHHIGQNTDTPETDNMEQSAHRVRKNTTKEI